MNQPPVMNREEVLRMRLEVLRQEHRDLDAAIEAMEATGRTDILTIRRFKKKKLALKDEITRVEDDLTPDIIA
jgi:hypothetical protein